jgi:hypothetical protein
MDASTRTDEDTQEPDGVASSALNPTQAARQNNDRYRYGIARGHRVYTQLARRLEGFYLGGNRDGEGNLIEGGQWSKDDLAILNEQGRPAYEFNEIAPAVRAAVGYQINNRLDIGFRPRGGDATKELAEVRTKVAKQIADNNQLHWKETEVFSDGLIQQRGYFDVRIDFEDTILGEVKISVLDPMDVIPDPDAKTYDPAGWSDVIVLRWLTLDEIEGIYGTKPRKLIEEARAERSDERDFGEWDNDGANRSKFGLYDSYDGYWDAEYRDGFNEPRIRIIDRQHYVRALCDVAVMPSGDVRSLSGDETPEVMEHFKNAGAILTQRRMKRVRWTVSTWNDILLHDAWSPYDRFTVVPYYPYFRRGQTRGMVDGAIDPQRALNKGVSQAIHIINSTANSGWQVEEGSLTNMTVEELEERGASTGLVMEVSRASSKWPQKIQPNAIPQGVERIIDRAATTLKEVTVPESMRGMQGAQESGLAIQSKQHAAQQQLAVPLDNLARTRNLIAKWLDYAMTSYYDSERVFRITKPNKETGKEETEEVVINKFDPVNNDYLNDMTAGEYDVVISEQPLQVTFENSQFQQALEMRQAGINIPDQIILRNSSLQDKYEAIEMMQAAAAPQEDPIAVAEAALRQARAEKEKALARKHDAEAVSSGVESMYSATQAAATIATQPAVSPLADDLLRSAGFVDRDAAPIIPSMDQPMPGVVPPKVNQNTSPMFPPRPGQPAPPTGGLDPAMPESPIPDTMTPKAGIETPNLADNMPADRL